MLPSVFRPSEEEDEILKRRAERKKDIVDLAGRDLAGNLSGDAGSGGRVYVDADVRRYMVDLAANPDPTVRWRWESNPQDRWRCSS